MRIWRAVRGEGSKLGILARTQSTPLQIRTGIVVSAEKGWRREAGKLPMNRGKSAVYIYTPKHVSGAERGASGSERGAERAKYSRSAERVFIQRPERSLCLAPVSLRYRSHHESRACTNPPRIHLCLQQLTKQPTLQKSFVVKERWSSWNISKSKPTGHTGAQFLSKN